MENKNEIEKILEAIRVNNLSEQEKAGMWHGVISKIVEIKIVAIPSSRTWSLNTLILIKKPMLSIFAIIAVLVLGISGTVAASDSARPGDLLFGVDRTVEDIRINFAGNDKKDDLRITFAEERVRELKNLIDDEQAIATSTISKIEVDVFTNETVVKIEAGNRKFVFTTSAKTKEAVIAEIMQKFDLSQAVVEANLSFETEDRASRPEDKGSGNSSDNRSRRVAGGIETATAFLELVSGQIASSTDAGRIARIEAILKALNDELGGLSADIKIDLRGDDRLRVRFGDDNSDKSGDDDGDDNASTSGRDGRVEIKTDDGKLKIEIKNGELRIKSNLSDDDSDSEDNGDDDSRNSSSSDSRSGLEAEADVFTDKTIVKVEVNDNKTVFTTLSKTREAVISDILAKFPSLSRTQIDAVLDLEIENRASRADDLIKGSSGNGGSDDDSSSNDDNSGSGSDDDSDDDNSGSGNDDDGDDDNSGSGNSGSGGSGSDD